MNIWLYSLLRLGETIFAGKRHKSAVAQYALLQRLAFFSVGDKLLRRTVAHRHDQQAAVGKLFFQRLRQLGAAAVMMMRSKVRCCGQPQVPSPT